MTYSFNHEQALETIDKLRSLIQTYFRENNITYAIFGKSEGLDSSVIAGLLANLEGVKPLGVILPIESDHNAERIARIVLKHFQIPHIKLDLTSEFHNLMGSYYSSESLQGQLVEVLEKYGDHDLLESLPRKKPIASGNVKVRLRMITLYHIAQLTGGLVVSTDNLSELWMGFWTLNGDVGDLAPIQHLWKGLEEYKIAQALGVPEESLDAVPTDGLEITPGGTDQDQLGLPYQDLDRVIVALLQNKFDGTVHVPDAEVSELSEKISKSLGFPTDKISHIAKQMMKTNHKRHWPHSFLRDQLGLTDIDDIDL